MRAAAQYQQRLNRIRYLCASESIVAMPSLPFDTEQPPLDEFGEVLAGRLWSHIGSHRQLTRRESEPTHQSQQNCGSPRIAQQVRGPRQFLVHGSIIG